MSAETAVEGYVSILRGYEVPLSSVLTNDVPNVVRGCVQSLLKDGTFAKRTDLSGTDFVCEPKALERRVARERAEELVRGLSRTTVQQLPQSS